MLGGESRGIVLGDQGDSWELTSLILEGGPLFNPWGDPTPIFITLHRPFTLKGDAVVVINVAHLESIINQYPRGLAGVRASRVFTYGDQKANSYLDTPNNYYDVVETMEEILALISKERQLIRQLEEAALQG